MGRIFGEMAQWLDHYMDCVTINFQVLYCIVSYCIQGLAGARSCSSSSVLLACFDLFRPTWVIAAVQSHTRGMLLAGLMRYRARFTFLATQDHECVAFCCPSPCRLWLLLNEIDEMRPFPPCFIYE